MSTDTLPKEPADQISDGLEDSTEEAKPDAGPLGRFRDGGGTEEGDKPGETPTKEFQIPESWAQK